MSHNLPVMIKLTHLQSGRPTFIKMNDITCVRLNKEGKTLVLQGDTGQYVEESLEEVLGILEESGFGFV